MKRWIARRAPRASAARREPAGGTPSCSCRAATARSGDLIAVWVKNGFELILNLGPVEQLGQGQVTSFEVPGEFDGNLVGAKFTALAVPNPDAVFTDLGLEPPLIQTNIALTTLGDPATVIFDAGRRRAGGARSAARRADLAQHCSDVIPAAGQTPT